MPRKGYNSLTVSDQVYDKLFDWYKKSEYYASLSFPKFISLKLEEAHNDKEKLQRLALKIKKIPIVIKNYK